MMNEHYEHCPPLNLVNENKFWAWVYNMKSKNNSPKKRVKKSVV